MPIRKRPTTDEIWEMLSNVRDEYYPYLKVGNVKIEISDRMTRTAAKVGWNRRDDHFLLIVSGRYFDEFGWYHELREILKHEIIHIRFPEDSHNGRFHQERDRIGATRYCRSRSGLKAKMMIECQNDRCGWIYKSFDLDPCPKCGAEGKMIGTVEE